jgi:hypothetical protein
MLVGVRILERGFEAGRQDQFPECGAHGRAKENVAAHADSHFGLGEKGDWRISGTRKQEEEILKRAILYGW